ncbi:uroporphyrinogen-III synthase [Aquicoccus porphyridii]|uniref:Uroporphyrinogen-III synthase n=1 Tax=Aquicoccus porphyridii TaxID=1852029 RepID=A0A5A9Z893_9RHOB|nr:uroporphyrinogen-III synthase [Aquicoccus porphyridii]KAA0913269.1 uroporphyrinogen-III synthase [Aquicoccus porphyridii]RAI52284.1 uroporphyrinogen-III synthase [Rhodobacteraceae bacterium AsT-22]
MQPVILLTRPAAAARRFADALRARLGEVRIVQSPLLRIEWVMADLPGGVAIFTSPRGVEGFLRAGGHAGRACWCVGDATAEAAAEAGFAPRSASGDAKALIAAILESGETGPFVHLRGKHAIADLAAILTKAGRETRAVVVYDQVTQPLGPEAQSLLQGEAPVVVPLFSPRTARQFAGECPVNRATRAPLFIAAMSGAVRDALGDVGASELSIAARPDGQAMVETVQGLFDAARRLEAGRGDK